MPHCRLGRELRPGDHILIPAIVKSVSPQEDYCNVTVVTEHPMPPYKDGNEITLNTKQVISIVEETK